MPKPDRDELAAEIKGMQLELRNLQNALADLVDAMITEEKPGPKEIKKLEALKKKAQNGKHSLAKEAVKPAKPKVKSKKKNKKKGEVSDLASFDK